jgi:hypothetical protein
MIKNMQNGRKKVSGFPPARFSGSPKQDNRKKGLFQRAISCIFGDFEDSLNI